MKNMRIPILSAMAVAIFGLIFGSIFDYQLSTAIASPTNGFGLFISVIAPTIGFCGLAFTGGGFFAISFKQDKLWVKILFIALAVLGLGIGTHFAGKEFFGENGFYEKAPNIVGYLISFVCAAGAEVGGYFVFKDCKNKYAWVSFACVYIVLVLVLVVGISGLKAIMHRPRFRTVADGTGLVPFHQWWERCADYKEYMVDYAISGEEFKSFPSGHTGEAAVLIVVATFLPLADERFKKIQLPLFIGAGCFVILVALSRILAAAHYLSDVSMGALITLVFTCIANELLIKFMPKDGQELLKQEQENK